MVDAALISNESPKGGQFERDRAHEICLARTRAGQLVKKATKGMWWMPWQQEAMKDAGACEKPRGAGKHAMIRGCPNGETRRR